MMQFKIVLVVLLSVVLSGCKNTSSYDYLVTHPRILDSEYAACLKKDAPSCEVVKQAAHDMGELMYEEANNPESFGKSIMALQQELNPNDPNYQQKQLKLQMMYAVIAAQGPE